MVQAGTQVCLVITIVWSVCVCACASLCVYMWLSVFEELLLRCGAVAARQQTHPDTASVRPRPRPQPGQVRTHRCWGGGCQGSDRVTMPTVMSIYIRVSNIIHVEWEERFLFSVVKKAAEIPRWSHDAATFSSSDSKWFWPLLSEHRQKCSYIKLTAKYHFKPQKAKDVEEENGVKVNKSSFWPTLNILLYIFGIKGKYLVTSRSADGDCGLWAELFCGCRSVWSLAWS